MSSGVGSARLEWQHRDRKDAQCASHKDWRGPEQQADARDPCQAGRVRHEQGAGDHTRLRAEECLVWLVGDVVHEET